jgi:hypothetical protein
MVPLGLASKLVVNGCSQFGLKTGGNGFSQIGLKIGGGGFFLAWVSKPAARFDDLCIKITATVSWFRPQN